MKPVYLIIFMEDNTPGALAEKDNALAEKYNTIAELGETISKNNNETAELQAEIKRLKSI